MTEHFTAPRCRRWFTVTIRLMMGLVLVTAVWLGWVVQRARAQRKAVAEIRRLHGIFSYDGGPGRAETPAKRLHQTPGG